MEVGFRITGLMPFGSAEEELRNLGDNCKKSEKNGSFNRLFGIESKVEIDIKLLIGIEVIWWRKWRVSRVMDYNVLRF